MTGRVVSLNRSRGGVPKLPVDQALVTVNGMEGDTQRDRRFHGGPDRALCVYSIELIDALVAEGHSVVPGVLGENVTVSGLDWRMMRPGRRLTTGTVEIELTGFASPCKNIRGYFLDEEMKRISEKRHPGWSRVYARVLREGAVRIGDPVTLK